MILLQNAKIFDGEKIINQNSILIKNNKFKNIGVNLKSSKDTNKINLKNYFVMPGLIDAHFQLQVD